MGVYTVIFEVCHSNIVIDIVDLVWYSWYINCTDISMILSVLVVKVPYCKL
jgi:hypothetical protein